MHDDDSDMTWVSVEYALRPSREVLLDSYLFDETSQSFCKLLGHFSLEPEGILISALVVI